MNLWVELAVNLVGAIFAGLVLWILNDIRDDVIEIRKAASELMQRVSFIEGQLKRP